MGSAARKDQPAKPGLLGTAPLPRLSQSIVAALVLLLTRSAAAELSLADRLNEPFTATTDQAAKPRAGEEADEVVVRGSLTPPSVLNPPAPVPPQPAAPPARAAEEPLPWYRRISIHGFADVYYAYNFNAPADGANFVPGYGTSGKRHNQFSLNLATVEINLDPEPVGARIVLGYGTALDVLHQGEPNAGPKDDGAGVGIDVWRFIQEASLSAKAPIGNGLTISAGILPGHLGFETLWSRDNWNYTRSFSADAVPYYQTGLRLSYPFTKRLSAQLFLLNGWQSVIDLNAAKSIGAQLLWSGAALTIAYNLWAGPELAGDNDHWRVLSELFVIGRLPPFINLALLLDIGYQQQPRGPDAMWYATDGYIQALLHKMVALSVRGGIFSDPGGVLTGTGQTLAEGTATLEIKPHSSLSIKLEGRYDRSTAAVFGTSERLRGGDLRRSPEQWMALIGTVATF